MPDKPTYQELEAKVLFLEERIVKDNHKDFFTHNCKDEPLFQCAGKELNTFPWKHSGQEKNKPILFQDNEKRFRNFIDEISSISIQGYDEERRVIFWNNASEKIYGWTEEEALGQKLENLIIPPAMKEDVKSLHHRWVHFGEKIPSGELILIDKAGNDVPVLSSHVMYESARGKEMFCIDVDLTSIKQAESEKEKLAAQLQQARKMEAVGTLAGGIAHDFNNILQAISGYVEILFQDKSRDHPDFQKLTAIATAADRGSHLIRQLLLFSRRAETIKKEINLNLAIQQGKNFLERIIPKMIEIRMNLSKEIWSIQADTMQMEQIILNIGGNAADAMPDGGTITIETANVSFNSDTIPNHMGNAVGDYVLLSISNTGEPMEKEILEKIFEPFFTTKKIGKGTGLGLASVYGIVKNHGGYISCTSEPGKETVFNIHLPALKQRTKPPANNREDAYPKGGEETILVVDDDKAVQDLACAFLKRFGYRPVTASDGEEALKFYGENTHKIDLVILDIGMPGMGGHKCLQELKTLNPSIRVVMSSGYSDDTSIETCLESGAMGYIGKPYKIREMLKKVRDLLDQ